MCLRAKNDIKNKLISFKKLNVSGGLAQCHFCKLGLVSPKHSPPAGSVFRNALLFVYCCHDPARFRLLQTVENGNTESHHLEAFTT